MEFLRNWAKSIYVLSVLSSIVIVLGPRRMRKEIKFVLEMLILLLVVSPLIGFIGKSMPSESAWMREGTAFSQEGFSSLEFFFEEETKRQVIRIAKSMNISVESVSLEPKGTFPQLSVASLEVVLGEAKSEEVKGELRKVLGTYLGIAEDNVTISTKKETP